MLLADEVLGVAGWLGCGVMMTGILLAGARGREHVAACAAAGEVRRGRRPPRRGVRLPLRGDDGGDPDRPAPRRGRGGGSALATVLTAVAVTAPFAFARGGALAGAWPFLLAGLLGAGLSQLLFTLAVREAGPSRTSVVVGTAPLFSVVIAVVLLGEPLQAGLVAGALLIVGGGVLLVSERGRPEHVRVVGLLLALAATVVFAVRDNLVRWLAVDTDVSPGAAATATLAAGAAVIAAYLVVTRADPASRRRQRSCRRESCSASRTCASSRRTTGGR